MGTRGIFSFMGIITSVFCLAQGNDAEFLVQPYLQDAGPDKMTIMWETSKGEESLVEWGASPKLGKKQTGISFDVNFTDARIHEVKITGLKRFTEYYYRVRTGKLVSDVFQFKTPPFASDHQSFNMLAMSDMQKDRQNPDKFSEIVNEGIIPYLNKEYGNSVPDNLALVMIPGDLVDRGSTYEQWQDDFFGPAQKLLAEVPVYPVLGNHERNSTFYFKYFSLPKNGTPAYAEHWWYKDYGNTRIIGLNSNDGYRDIGLQYEWLEKVLAETAQNEDIDFVFAQLHHPHKSELWIPGEEESTGKVVKMLEDFTTATGKPSIHFFGHTHGYSRGQSKDHKHLWVNVASAGGAIDNWGEFEGRDYDEFSVTQDEYGFVMVEVDGSKEHPKFTLKRISRGNENVFRENEQTDEITIYAKDHLPETPTLVAPIDLEVPITGALLKAGPFKSTFMGAYHAASHWQVSTTADFTALVFDSWKQSENWYYLEDRQKGDDLTDEPTNRLKPNTIYFWRVRYRDQHLNWSKWSKSATFKTNMK
ncbi:fibronectin type III domain-containing protein [Maribacter polysiphoniae]|uniref:Purple acid phosphatase-like protein n=2 Tax=Maribacter polysiphoniae TaxID=429344 RepID=A0A316E3I6_9FLAO|nr:fibronectin type III domain-containing protein [Maribacter polysiphoniae]PWK24971.1 purple acid phosphatase-like protein [Maribacter polysiphoniae]